LSEEGGNLKTELDWLTQTAGQAEFAELENLEVA
jgi:hypothetical protein